MGRHLPLTGSLHNCCLLGFLCVVVILLGLNVAARTCALVQKMNAVGTGHSIKNGCLVGCLLKCSLLLFPCAVFVFLQCMQFATIPYCVDDATQCPLLNTCLVVPA